MNTGDTHIDLESLLIPNPNTTILVNYKENGRTLWLVVDRAKKPAPGELALVASNIKGQKFILQEFQPGVKVFGAVTYVIAPCP